MATRLATYRTQADARRSREIAKQRKQSSSPLAQFRTEAAAYRAGYTESQLRRSPFGRDLIERATHARQQRRATQRNQSYNYILKAEIPTPPGYIGPHKTIDVTIRSDKPLSNKQVAQEASHYFKAKREHYGDANAIGEIFPDGKPPRMKYLSVLGNYRGAIMRQPIRTR